MRKIIGMVGVILALALVGTACAEQDTSKTDIDEPQLSGDATPETYEARTPELLIVYLNVDNHPTIVKLCIDGVAFRTISSLHSGGIESGAVARVPEWDGDCAGGDG